MKLALAITVALVAAASTLPAQAGITVLTYDITGTGIVPPDYGDRVTGPAQGNYGYGGSGSYTPNVVVDYLQSPLGSPLPLWSTGYGDLSGVAYGHPNTTRLTYTFTADPGYYVTLLGFDLGGWLQTAQTVSAITVQSGSAVLLTLPNVVVPGTASGHADVDFVPPPIGQTLSLDIDVAAGTGLWVNLGLDNLAFGQTTSSSGIGMFNSPAASLRIGGFGPTGLAGPFNIALPPNGVITLDWAGPAGMPVVLATGNLHPNAANFGCIGILDIGTPPAFADFSVLFNGTIPGFPNSLFRLTSQGTAFQAFSVPSLTGNVVTLQGAVLQPPGSPCPLALTAAFHISFL